MFQPYSDNMLINALIGPITPELGLGLVRRSALALTHALWMSKFFRKVRNSEPSC